MTERRIGPFIPGTQIGVGGMGVVYEATYVETGKKVALKVLPPSLAVDPKMFKRFEREIAILKRMDHPNIVKYYGGGTHNGQRWYAMELIDGGSLQDILKKKKRLSWEQAIQVGRQLCAALEHAHNAGIIHRDLKPGNLFVTKKGRIKLGDFGIARDTEATALTAAGKTVGTYAYMAPEQIEGNAAISGKTDLYAAGCLLYEVLTGETPFLAENPAKMLMQHLNDDPWNVREKVLDCPQALDELIDRMLAKKPEDRPYDALAVHTELTNILRLSQEVVSEASPQTLAASKATTAVDPLTGQLQRKKKKKKKKDKTEFYEKTWFLVTCLVGLIGVAFWLMRGPGEDALCLQAHEAVSQSRTVDKFYDAKRLYLVPYFSKYPNGKHVAEMRKLLDRTEVAILLEQAERRLQRKADGRNPFERKFLTALQAERDETRNPLESIELCQENLNALTAFAKPSTATFEDSILDLKAKPEDNPSYWKLLTMERLTEQKRKFAGLAPELRDGFLTARMEAAQKLLHSDKPDDGRRICSLFRDAFRDVSELDPWREYARLLETGSKAQMPNGSRQQPPGQHAE